MHGRRGSVGHLLVCLAAALTSALPAAARASLVEAEDYGNLPVVFEKNTGQTSGRVQFLSRGSGYALISHAAARFSSLARGREKASR
jgi:hypothetical protein